MADKDKKGREAKRILQSNIRTVTSILQGNPNKFYLQLVEESLVDIDAYDPDDKTMNKLQQITKLYTQCMKTVEYTPSHFPKLMDILSYYPPLEQIVDEMKKKGKK